MMANTTDTPVSLEMFQNESRAFTFTITDDDGDAVNLTGKTLRFVAQDSQSPPGGEFKVEGGGIDMTNAANGVVVVTIPTSASATAGTEFHWRLWNTNDNDVLANGSLVIRDALADV